MDDQTMEQVDSFRLDSLEAACSMCTVSFADDPTEYFAVGTAYVLPEEPEPTKASHKSLHCWAIACHSLLAKHP